MADNIGLAQVLDFDYVAHLYKIRKFAFCFIEKPYPPNKKDYGNTDRKKKSRHVKVSFLSQYCPAKAVNYTNHGVKAVK
jgi:hypothetical protein